MDFQAIHDSLPLYVHGLGVTLELLLAALLSLSTVADLSAALVHPEAETKEKPVAAPRKRRKPAAD